MELQSRNRLTGDRIIRFLKVHENAVLPSVAHKSDTCFDFFLPDGVRLYAHSTTVVPLGLKVILPEGHWLRFEEKSGLAADGVVVGGGIIDEGYRGELSVILRYVPRRGATSDLVQYGLGRGDKVVQGRLVTRIGYQIEEITDEDFGDSTARGSGGFGSTGR